MAKETTPAALATPELPGLSRRGRPYTGKALSNAERQARYRAKNRSRPPLDAAQADHLADRLQEVQERIFDQYMDMGLLAPGIRPHMESWYREIYEIRQALLGRSLSRGE